MSSNEVKDTVYGTIPSHWKMMKIIDYTEIVTDYVANGSFASLKQNVQYKDEPDVAVLIRLVDYNNNFNGEFVYISEDSYSFLKKSKLYGDEIIISNVGANVGTVFKCPKLKYKMSLAPNSIMMKTKGHDDFYYYWLKSRYGQFALKSIVSGSAQPKFNKTDFRNLTVPVPPIEEQKTIAATLSFLDDKIELNNHINKNLEEMAQVIFKNWFVDFEPFQDSEFEDSELGMIPKGWRVAELGESVELINGYSYKGSELKESADALMTIKNFDRNGGFKIDGFKEIEISERVKERHYVNIFDLLIACTDLTQNAEIIGNPILIFTKSKYNKLVASMDLVKIVSKSASISNFFLYTMLRNENFKQFALGYTSGTTVLHLDKKGILQYKVALPCDMQILTDFSAIIEPLFKLISKKINESESIINIRDSLLPKLMSGEIRVPIKEV